MASKEMQKLIGSEESETSKKRDLLRVEEALSGYYQEIYPKQKIGDFRAQLKKRLLHEAETTLPRTRIKGNRKIRTWSGAAVAVCLLFGFFTWGYTQLMPTHRLGDSLLKTPVEEISSKEPGLALLSSEEGEKQGGAGEKRTEISPKLSALLSQNFLHARVSPAYVAFDFTEAKVSEFKQATLYQVKGPGITPNAGQRLALSLGLTPEKMEFGVEGYRLEQNEGNLEIILGPETTINFSRLENAVMAPTLRAKAETILEEKTAFNAEIAAEDEKVQDKENAVHKVESTLETLGEVNFFKPQEAAQITGEPDAFVLALQQQIGGIKVHGAPVQVSFNLRTGEIDALKARFYTPSFLDEYPPVTRDLLEQRLKNGDYWKLTKSGPELGLEMQNFRPQMQTVKIKELGPLFVYLSQNNEEGLLIPMYRVQGLLLEEEPFEGFILAW